MPRECRLTGSGKFLVILSIILGLAAPTAGVGLGMLAARQAEEVRLLRTEGQVTEGRITRLWRTADKEHQPRVAYEFSVRGRVFVNNARLPLSYWRKLKTGDSILVSYVPARPDINHPDGFARGALSIWFPVLLAVGLAVGSFCVTIPLRRQRFILTYGRVAPGWVTSHGRTRRSSHGTDLGKPYFYDFRLLSGATANGKAGPTKTPPAVGSLIPVVYDPDNPRCNTAYPLSLCKLNKA